MNLTIIKTSYSHIKVKYFSMGIYSSLKLPRALFTIAESKIYIMYNL